MVHRVVREQQLLVKLQILSAVEIYRIDTIYCAADSVCSKVQTFLHSIDQTNSPCTFLDLLLFLFTTRPRSLPSSLLKFSDSLLPSFSGYVTYLSFFLSLFLRVSLSLNAVATSGKSATSEENSSDCVWHCQLKSSSTLCSFLRIYIVFCPQRVELKKKKFFIMIFHLNFRYFRNSREWFGARHTLFRLAHFGSDSKLTYV